MRYLHTIRRHSILKFHMKKKWINFDSYLDKQRTHCNAMRKIYVSENTSKKPSDVAWESCMIGRLLRKSTQLMSSGLPQTTKSRKFTVERDEDCDTFGNFHTNAD